jgi:hypothetical protein
VVQAIRNWEAKRAGNPLPTQEVLLASQIHSVSYRVAAINQSTTVSDEEVIVAMAALQTQVRRDFAPVWGVDAELTFIPRDADGRHGGDGTRIIILTNLSTAVWLYQLSSRC